MGKMTEDEEKGLGIAIVLFIIWGSLPIFWKIIHYISPLTILSHRIVWSLVCVSIIMFIKYPKAEILEPLKEKKNILIFIASSSIITINWGTYIWAIVNERIVEASMGYYINPIVMILFGMIFFKEKLDLMKKIAIIVAAIGVAFMIFQYKSVPIVALTLAISFAIYGVLKKKLNVNAAMSLFYETLFMFPLALGYVIYSEVKLESYFIQFDPKNVMLLAIAGMVTVIPLILFASAVKKVRLTTLGFIQYLAPTISLLLGVIIYKEEFDLTHWITFGFIWAALIIYTISNILPQKKKAFTEESELVLEQKKIK